jgi:hypothetical protein
MLDYSSEFLQSIFAGQLCHEPRRRGRVIQKGNPEGIGKIPVADYADATRRTKRQ